MKGKTVSERPHQTSVEAHFDLRVWVNVFNDAGVEHASLVLQGFPVVGNELIFRIIVQQFRRHFSYVDLRCHQRNDAVLFHGLLELNVVVAKEFEGRHVDAVRVVTLRRDAHIRPVNA